MDERLVEARAADCHSHIGYRGLEPKNNLLVQAVVLVAVDTVHNGEVRMALRMVHDLVLRIDGCDDVHPCTVGSDSCCRKSPSRIRTLEKRVYCMAIVDTIWHSSRSTDAGQIRAGCGRGTAC